MIELRRISLVNWYLIDAIDIEIKGGTAIVGGNAVGKSSILDAVQVVITGNNKNYWRPNASSGPGEKQGRKVRDYCLGQVLDPELGPPRRESAITYICLTFEREGTGETWSAGVALSANVQWTTEELDGLFIVPGMSLTTADFLEPSGGPNEIGTPWTWEALRRRLERECPGFEDLRKTPERFVQHLLQHLRGRRGHADARRYLKAFRNAIAFKPINDPTKFVRDYVLDPSPVQVKRLRESVQTYREILDRIENLQRREEALNEIADLFDRLARANEERNVNGWIAAQAANDRTEEELNRQTAEQAAIQKKLSGLQSALERNRDTQESLRSQIGEKEATLRSSEIAIAIGRTELAIEAAETRRKKLERQKSDLRKLVENACRLSDTLGLSLPGSDDARRAMEILTEHAGLAAGLESWPLDPIALDEALANLAEPLAALARRHEEIRDQLNGERSAAERRVRDLAEQMARMKEGRAPLRPAVQKLYDTLADRGFQPEVMCGVVDIEDELWRDAIETLLGPAREAIIVPPEYARVATSILRARRHEFMGCQLVNTTRTAEVPLHADPRSLAGVISTDNPHARAYLNIRLGRVIRVESEEELLRERQAITPDCLSINSLGVEARRPVDLHLLGRSVLGKNLPAVQERLAEARQEATVLKNKADPHAAAVKRIEALLTVLSARPEAAGLTHKIDNEQATIDELQRDIASLKAEQPEDLVDALEDLRKELAEFEEEGRDIFRSLGDLKKEEGKVETALWAATEAATKAAASMAVANANIGESFAKAQSDYEAQREKGLDFGQIQSRAAQKRSAAEEDVSRLKVEAPRAAYDYSREHRVEFNFEAGGTPGEIEAWVRTQLDSIRNNILRDYQPQAEAARVTMEESLREDLLTRLAANFNDINVKLDELNQQLGSRVFHGERYKFTASRVPANADIIEVANRVYENPREVTDLFTNAEAYGELVARGVDRIRKIIESEESGLAEIEDYRQYFTFELHTFDPDGNPKSKLSTRLGLGSGGEKQVPFYVAIAAAMASTCHQRDAGTREDLGHGLVLFDEAFNNLDDGNIAGTLDFMRELNLQILAAAPEGKRPQFTERLETIVNVYRDGNMVHIQVDRPKERARELLRRENPANISLADFRKVYAQLNASDEAPLRDGFAEADEAESATALEEKVFSPAAE